MPGCCWRVFKLGGKLAYCYARAFGECPEYPIGLGGGFAGAAEPRQGRASRYGGALRGRTLLARPESGAKYGNQREEVTSCQVEEV